MRFFIIATLLMPLIAHAGVVVDVENCVCSESRVERVTLCGCALDDGARITAKAPLGADIETVEAAIKAEALKQRKGRRSMIKNINTQLKGKKIRAEEK